jgi:hypothetical protein
MSHKIWRPISQTSFEAREDTRVPHFIGTYHSREIATQWYWITPSLFEYTTL